MVVLGKLTRMSVFVFVGVLMLYAGDAVAVTDTPDTQVPQVDGSVWALAQSGNTVYVGGQFTYIGGVARNGLAAFDATTGEVDLAWNPNVNNHVSALAVSGGKVYAGGNFTTVNGGTTRNCLAAFNEANGVDTGTTDAAWNPDIDPYVNDVLVYEGKLYVAGAFSTVNGGTITRANLAAFNLADGTSAATVDPAWIPAPDASVTTLAASPGKLYVGGYFSTLLSGAVTRNFLAALNLADGVGAAAVDSAWNPNPNSLIHVLEASSNRLYVGGEFTWIGSTSRYGLVALTLANGASAATVDVPWNTHLGISPPDEIVIADNKVIVGGVVMTAGSGDEARNGLLAFNEADGVSSAVLDAWDPNVTEYGWVNAIVASGSGGVIVGGQFDTIAGSSLSCLAGFGAGELVLMPLSWISIALAMLAAGVLVVWRRKAHRAPVSE